MRLVAAAVLVGAIPSAFAAPSLSDSNLIVQPYLSANRPTGIRFTGPNEGFFIEQAGAVKHFAAGSVSTALNLQVATDGGERGAVGLAVDPNFGTNRHVYLYHTAGTDTGAWTGNELTRYTWNGTNLVSPLPLGTFGTATDGQSTGPIHNGGPLVFGLPSSGANAGKLFGVTGDLNRNGIEQNQSATNSAFTGGVYRLNPDGTIPTDNPFVGNSNTDVRRLYSYGLRNSFGVAFDPVTGALWNTENGPNSYDEINLVTPGMNSGWRPIMGPDSRDTQNAPGDLVTLPGATYQDPKFSFQSPIGITSIQFLAGSAWGDAYDDAVLVGEAINTRRLWLFRLNGTRDEFILPEGLTDKVLDDADTFAPFGTDFRTVTDIQVGPDGAVYIASLVSNAIYRVAPVPEPHTWILSLTGLALVGWLARRRAALRG